MNNSEKEVRSCEIDYRYEPETRQIKGYAIVFSSRSHNLGGFVEEIMPEAMNDVIERSDIVALLNHDNSRGILGRCKRGSGSLKLNVDERGVEFEVEAPNTSLGDECLEYLRRGDATQCSFAFTVADGGDRWTKLEDGTYLRQITQFDRIFDVSVLTCTPAYEATSVSCKRFAEIQEEERLENERKMKEAEERAAAEEAQKEQEREEQLKKIYDGLRKEYEEYLKK